MHRNMNLKRLRALRAVKGTERISSASLLSSLTSESVDEADFCSVLAERWDEPAYTSIETDTY